MLTSPTTFNRQRNCRHSRFALRRVLAVIAMTATWCAGSAHAQQANYPTNGYSYYGGPIRQVAQESSVSPPVKKPLHPLIASMPDVNEELEVIHHRSQMIVTRSNVIRTAIADPSVLSIVQYTPREIAIIGNQLGATTLTVWFEDNTEPLIYLVKIIRDPNIEEQRRVDYGKLERKLADLFPDSTVQLIPLSYKIIVRGQARDSEEAAQILSIVRGEVINQDGSLVGTSAQAGNYGGGGGGGGGGASALRNRFNNANDFYSSFIVNMLEVPGEFQVMLHVRVCEVNRSMLRRMGVDLNIVFNDARHIIGTSIGGIPSTFTGLFENGEIGVLVNWLASNGTAKILAEPSLTVLSGHEAEFLAGGEFAVPTIVGVGGAQGTSTTFRGFGTSLNVVPTVIDRDLIRMQIEPEFSEIDSGNSVQGIPGLSSRRAETTVELREGQTVVIAGLLSSQTSTEVTRIPVLGELPWIGPTLFNAKRSSQDETELLILVTPQLVRPMEPDEVPPIPGHEITTPTDYELYRWAMTEGAPDQGVYQLNPYGQGPGRGTDIGYNVFNPDPAIPAYNPQPGTAAGMGANYNLGGGGYSPPAMGQPMPMYAPQPGYAPQYAPQPTPAGMPTPLNGYPQTPQQPLTPIPDPAASGASMNPGPNAGPTAYGPQTTAVGGPQIPWSTTQQQTSGRRLPSYQQPQQYSQQPWYHSTQPAPAIQQTGYQTGMPAGPAQSTWSRLTQPFRGSSAQ